MSCDHEQEILALKAEARHWQRKATRKIAEADAALIRACGIGAPTVTVKEGETWWRVYVNGVYIDGCEDEKIAEVLAARLREAFKLPRAVK